MDGMLMFAKYAFPPNSLQFCGPSDNKALFEILGAGDLQKNRNELKNLLLQFQGAVPYLRLIAAKNGIKDIFDKRVVEAYWLGNSLLGKIQASDLSSHLESRFLKSIRKKDWSWLVDKSLPGARPCHNFHVFDIYRRVATPNQNQSYKIVENMNNCRISWGKIEAVDLNEGKGKQCFGMALVTWSPLIFWENKFSLLKTSVARRAYLSDPEIKYGDIVSLHWDYVCDKITPVQKKNLEYWTNYHLKLANQTI